MKSQSRIRYGSIMIFLCCLFFVPLTYAGEFTGTTPAIEAKIDSILSQLTLDEKSFMLHANSMFSSGGVERFGLSELNYTDGPFGVREELERFGWNSAELTTDSATFFPTGTALAATWNIELTRAYGSALGRETRARDKDMLLGPSVNLIRTPLSGRNFEFFTEDPYLNARLAVNYVKGMQSEDVAACVKHYVLNNQETHRGFVSVEIGERAMRELYLPAFRDAVIEGHALGIMSAYNRVREEFCSENGYLLNDILKDEWGFQGVVVSDWGGTHSTINAANGGLDIEMGSRRRSYDQYFLADSLKSAVKNGNVDESVVDDKVRRILRVMMAVKSDQPDRKQGELVSAYNRDVAYKVASEAVVLLNNETGLLPLDAKKLEKIVVIGDNATREHAQGGFGAQVKTKYEVTPLNALQEKYGEQIDISYVQGYTKDSEVKFWPNPVYRVNYEGDSTLIAEAAAAAKDADAAVLFIGLNHDFDTEARDRDTLKLAYGQDELVKAVTAANPNTAVVVIAGGIVDLNTVKQHAKSVLWMGLNGSEAGNAIADVLFGEVNPSGKMPFTVPLSLQDSPEQVVGEFPGSRESVTYNEGLLVGYRWYDTKEIEPAYPFGYGLSYTTFDYKSCDVQSTVKADDTLRLDVAIANTGDTDGAEVIQVYARKLNSQVQRPDKELKAFDKVMLKVGETRDVSLELPVSSLAYYNTDANAWTVEPGDYELLIGSSSRDIRLVKQVTVE